MKQKIKTMEELAAAIGISRPTLSRFFRDADSVRASTRKKIEDGLETVDYVPNFFATRLNRKSTGLIGVIIPDTEDLFFARLLNAIERPALEADYTVLRQNSHGSADLEARAVETFLSMNVDGVIVAPLGRESSADVFARLSTRLPIVLVDSRLPHALPSVDFVGTNNRQSIDTLVNYLCRTGAPPHFFGMPPLNTNSPEREAAYVASMERLGFKPVLVEVPAEPDSWEFEAYAYDVMDEHFGSGRYVDATILCANDRLATGVLRAAGKHGLLPRRSDVKAKLRVAGHDDNPMSRFMTPSLTTVAQNFEAIGRSSFRLLLRRIEGDTSLESSGTEEVFDTILRIRESA
ncbi:LacI family DNA-binding transcriptional regulator [Tropicimonas sp. TH_r6]|uniref:LacI family DNA-binding transcriptional regulator n=1 Tax=Tropicimonas sp. TH_r6 TaxID=3082085 RepID=UPI0029546243|nr:LacI family DNA-binding transcriptional regulator [Tropicimonas sp. TH_r6]MDV7145347.1 LacI family DNA-binding transcriptional regulator [Tropicimonas sp. TH_r6]